MNPRPDSEGAFVAYLQGKGYNAATRVPRQHADGMVRVARVAGKRRGPILDRPTVLIEAWHEEPYEASLIVQRLTADLEAIPQGGHLTDQCRVYDIDATGPVEFPDDQSALACYQTTVTCSTRLVI